MVREMIDKVVRFHLIQEAMENKHIGIKQLEKDRSLPESQPQQTYSKEKTSTLRKAATATIMGAVKFVGPLLFLVTSLFCMVDSYPDLDLSHIGCNECALKKNDFFSRDKPVYQCKGCCFSMAYPTPHWIKKLMMNPKNITSEAACCTARNSELVKVQNLMVRNHTECYCDTCIYHKI
ncbi:glycoprotein hormones alpha chain-like [Hippocampus zosterae]|uniref:glycoprotein hormones alpha chain-like n=1 Tax=Hippocampus zosterae TaxID=109293 RepID=UPI00223D8B66|nr:glycoprotein hormones alpha chain-like [Hippocampus zosterae]